MRRNIANALSAALLGAAFFAAATPVSQAQTALRRQSQTATQSASTVAKSAAATPPASNAGAYARVKNFVDADAVLVARLDLAQLDLDAIDKSFSKFFVDSFAAQGFDATSLKEIRRELNKFAKAFKETATPLLDSFREERGLREAYLIVPRASEPEYFVYAPVAKSKRAAVVALATPFAPNAPFEVGSGVVFGTKKFDADYFKRFKATPNPKLEAFLAESNATLQIYVGDVNVAPAAALVGAFAQNDLAQKFDAALAQAPQETRAAVKAFDDYFIDARLELDVNALALNARFDFASADAASKTRAALAQFADAGVADLEKALIAKAAEKNAAQFEKYNVVPVVRELVRGFLTSSLPKRDGAALSFELQASPSLPLANPLTGAFVFAALPQALKGVQNAAGASDATADSPRASIFSLVAPKNEKVEPAAQTDAAQTDAPQEAENVETAPSTDAPAVGKVKIAPKSDAAQADDVKQLFDAFAAATKPAKGAEESEEIVVTNPDVLNATAEGFHPTTVTVLYEGGHPATGVLVTLHSFDPTNEIKDQPKGIVDKEGKAVIVTGVVPGVRPGKYAVTLENQLNPVIEFEGYETVVRLIIPDRKYESPRGSGLSVEIKEGENQFKFDSIPLYVVEPR